MTKILIVEDDAAQARVLARAISQRRPDYTVLTSPNGLQATRLLRDEEVDLVLTDLQMPEMNGFELLAWLLEHRPSVAVFTMTAYGSDQTESQLSTYGPIACFTKPVDVEKVVERMTESLSQNVRGHVHNMNLPPFLQLIELERMSCTLNVERAGQRATLFLQNGELADARLGRLSGEAAATAVLGWTSTSITISGSGANVTRSIEKPMSYVIMEALRLQDEGARMPLSSLRPSLPLPPLVLEEETYGLTLPANVMAVAVMDLRSGVILAYGQRASVPLAELSEMALTIMRQEEHTLSCFGEPDEVQELVLTTPSSCELIRRLPGSSPAFVLCVFKPDETNLVMARLELERLLADPAWLPSRPD